MVGVPYRRITHLRKHLAARVPRRRAHPRLGHRSISGSARAGQPPGRLLGRHRPQRAADHPRPRAAVGADRHPDRRVHLRRPGSRVGRRRRGAAGRGRPADRGARAARCSSPPSRWAGPRSWSTACTGSIRAGKIPDIPIYVDSPLAVDATTVFRMHPEIFDQREELVANRTALFDFPLVRYIRDVADSKALNTLRGPGRDHRRVGHGASRAASSTTWPTASATTATWFCSSASRRSTPSAAGSRTGEDVVKILGQEYQRRAEVETIGGYSAHADRTELRAWVRRLGGPIRRAFVVHGEPPALEAMAAILREEGVPEVDPAEARRERSSCVSRAPCSPFAAVSPRSPPIGLHLIAHHGAGGQPAGPAAAGGRDRRARRRAVQRPAVAGAARPARSRARPVPRRTWRRSSW